MASYVDSFYFLPSAPIRCCGNLQQQNARPDIERRLCPCNYQFERDAMQDMQAQFSHARFRDPPPQRLAAGGLSFHNRTNRRYIIIIID